MSAANCRAARRKMFARYGRGNGKRRTVAESITAEKDKAARQAAAAGKKKT